MNAELLHDWGRCDQSLRAVKVDFCDEEAMRASIWPKDVDVVVDRKLQSRMTPEGRRKAARREEWERFMYVAELPAIYDRC